MSTYNGIGTLHFDWQRNSNGSADATEWFVVFFLPIFPIARVRVRVLETPIKRSGILSSLLALTGNGSGFETRIEVLGRVPNSVWRIIRTYLVGFIVVPFVSFLLPILILSAVMLIVGSLGFDLQRTMSFVFPIFGICLCVWMGVVVASILDRCAGRHHVYKQEVRNQWPGHY